MKKIEYSKGLYIEWSDAEWARLQEARGMRAERIELGIAAHISMGVCTSRDMYFIEHYHRDLDRREIAELFNISSANAGWIAYRLRKKGYDIPRKNRGGLVCAAI